MFCILNPYQIYGLQIFPSILYVVFSFSYNNVFATQMSLILVNLMYLFFVLFLMLWRIIIVHLILVKSNVSIFVLSLMLWRLIIVHLILVKSNVSVFVLLLMLWRLIIGHCCQTQSHEDLFLYFRRFVVLDFTFRSLIYFELSFYGVR